LLKLWGIFLCLLTENSANAQTWPLAAGADREITRLSVPLDPRQLKTVAGYHLVNDVSLEDGVSDVALDDSHVVSTVGQSLSDPSDIIKSPCVVQNVYSLPVQ